jgi:hypothetical protein
MIYDKVNNELSVTCRWCKQTHKIDMSVCGGSEQVEVALKNWQRGMLIQNTFPQLGNDERELMISQTCAKCWEELFKETEDELDSVGEEDDDE